MNDMPASPQGPPPATAVKNPPRFRWTKRLFVVWLLAVAAFLTMRYAWLHIGKRRVADQLAAIAARGETADWVALQPPHVPDEQNALVAYQQAAGKITELALPAELAAKEAGWYGAIEYFLNSDDSLAGDELAEQLMRDNEEVFALVRDGRGRPRTDWGLVHTSPAINFMLPSLAPMRRTAKLLCVRARWQADQGRWDEAAETFADIDALARAVSADHILINQLVSVAIHALSTRCVEDSLPGLRPEALGRPLTEAERSSLKSMIEGLTDDSVREGMHRAAVGERAGINNHYDCLLDGSLSPVSAGIGLPVHPWRWLLEPSLRCDQAWSLQMLTVWVDQSKSGRLPEVSMDDLAMAKFERPLGELRHPLARMLLPSLSRANVLVVRADAARRMAAVAIALRLYESDHGRPAEDLPVLVPEYLPSLPADPSDPAGGPVRAILTGDRPRLYCLGPNLRDDGGDGGPDDRDTEAPDWLFCLQGRAKPEPETLPARAASPR